MSDPQFWTAALAVAAPLCFFFGFRNWRLARLIEDTPVSRVRSAAQGYLELSGVARFTDGAANTAPLSKMPCVWWRYKIERRIENDKNRRWETINSGASVAPFKLEDSTGICLVGPASADVRPAKKATWYGSEALPAALGGGEYRYTEHRIHENEQISVIGEFLTFGGAGSGGVAAEVARLLSEWQQDQSALLQRVDGNHDGILSQLEWERARDAARAQIDDQRTHTRSGSNALSMVVQPQDGRPFLLPACDLRRLARNTRWAAGALWAAFLVSVATLAVMVFGQG